MKTVFAYTRVSTVRQGTIGSSLAEQKAAIEHYARQNSLSIKAWFEEQETAAKQGRPVFGKMMGQLKLGEASGVVIHKIDRSARNLRDWADLGELVDQGLEIHLAHESLDLNSRGGRLAADIQAVVAADYVRNLRQEILKGIKGRLKQGLWPWPAPPGYLDMGAGKPKILDPEAAPLIRHLFEMYATGEYSLRALANEARIMGLTGRGGRPLSPNGISTIFHNAFYTGIMVHRPTGERYIGAHEPLISQKLFETVGAILDGKMVRKEAIHAFPFRRMIRCRSCHSYITGERQKGRVYYRCHTRSCSRVSVRQDALRNYLATHLSMLTLPADALPALRSEFEHLMEERFGDRERLRQAEQLRFTKREERISTLTDRYLDGDIDRQTYLDRKERLVIEQSASRERLASISSVGSPMGTRFEHFFELQSSLYKSENLLSEVNLSRFGQKVFSNLSIDGKNLAAKPQMAFQEVLDALGVPDGGPTCDFVRTRLPRRQLSPSKIKNLARKLFDAWQRESER